MRQESFGKRHAVRTSVQLRAQMRFPNGRPTVDCIIRDISPTGARIVLLEDMPIPNEFDVHIPARSETKWARVRWREKLQVGVEFLKFSQEERDSLEATLLSRIDRLEAQVSGGGSSRAGRDSLVAAALDRIAALEAKLADLGRERIEPNLNETEGRPELVDLSESEDALRRLEDMAHEFERIETRLSRLEVMQGGATTHERPADGEGLELASRMNALENSVHELRASLRTLILLTAAQVKRSGG